MLRAGHHEFQRKIIFQVQTLVALHRIRSRMSFGKSVARKGKDLVPNLFGECFGIAFFRTIVPEFTFQPLKVMMAHPFSAHAAAQNIGFFQGESGKEMRDLDHIFLVDHHSIGFCKYFTQHRVRLLTPLRIAMAFDVFFFHSAIGNPGPDDRTRCHQSQVIICLQL